jgi:hypothetical protein
VATHNQIFDAINAVSRSIDATHSWLLHVAEPLLINWLQALLEKDAIALTTPSSINLSERSPRLLLFVSKGKPTTM